MKVEIPDDYLRQFLNLHPDTTAEKLPELLRWYLADAPGDRAIHQQSVGIMLIRFLPR